MGFSYIEFSPYIYIRSSPRKPNRDLNWTLGNKLLLYNLQNRVSFSGVKGY